MTDNPAVSGAPAPLSLPARVIGVITSPTATFRSIVAHPQWLGVLALSVLVIAGAFAWFLSTETGQQAVVDQQVSTLEGFGQVVSDEQYASMRRQAEYAWMIQPGTILVVSPIVTAIIAGILYLVFGGMMGGESTYKQVLAVTAHAGVISVLQTLFATPLYLARGSMTSPTNLSVFLPMLEEGTFLASLLGGIDLFVIWWLVVLATGLGVLYKRRTMPVFWSLFVVYVVIVAGFAAIKSMMGGA